MQPADINIAIQWAGKEGWNPGLEDSSAFFATDPNGFFIGILNGKPVSCISAVRYGNRYGFVGFYIVQEEYRGKGYGVKIWQHALNHLGQCVSGLDGVPAQIKNYRKSGYAYQYKQMRFEAKNIEGLIDKEIEVTFSYPEILEYDTSVFGTERNLFLHQWLNMGHAKVFCMKDGKGLKGYAVIRQCLSGYKIGPLFAADKETAEKLFLACCAAAKGPVYLDIPEINKGALEIAEKYNMQLVFETARMYKNGYPNFPVEKVFGVTTFELG
jgi:hypothetical protein